jgi:hypothetical protein
MNQKVILRIQGALYPPAFRAFSALPVVLLISGFIAAIALAAIPAVAQYLAA